MSEDIHENQELAVPSEFVDLCNLAQKVRFNLCGDISARMIHRLIKSMLKGCVSERDPDLNTPPLTPDELLAKLTLVSSSYILFGALAYNDPVLKSWKKEAVIYALQQCVSKEIPRYERVIEEYTSGRKVPESVLMRRRVDAMIISNVKYTLHPAGDRDIKSYKVEISDTPENRANPRYSAYFKEETNDFEKYNAADRAVKKDQLAMQIHLEEQDEANDARQLIASMTGEIQTQNTTSSVLSMLKMLNAESGLDSGTTQSSHEQRSTPAKPDNDKVIALANSMKLLALLPRKDRDRIDTLLEVRKQTNILLDLQYVAQELNRISNGPTYTPVNSA